MKTNTVITISRQFGSGGRIIAQALAKELDIPYYDKEVIELAAKESGMDVEDYEKETTKTSRAFYVLGAINYTLGSPVSFTSDMSINDRLYECQSQMITNLVNQGPCVIVGRCADAILADREKVLNIFFHAKMEDRIKRTVEEYGVNNDEVLDIEDFISKIDKQRANYYHYYTNQKWGKSENYHLVIDTSKFSVPQIISMIKCIIAK